MAGVGIDTKIYPDMVATPNVFGGGSMSKQSTSMQKDSPEYMRATESLTLDEMMYSDMRKKIPGMTRVPKAKLDNINSLKNDWEQKKNDHINFVKQNFTMLECHRFVPKHNQKVNQRRDLRCECGAVLSDHAGMYGITARNIATRDMMEQFLIPEPLKKIMSQDKRMDPPPKELPKVEWNRKESFRTSVTNAFGKINFINVEYTGGKKPAKYVRLSVTDPIDKLITLMKDHWRIMEPRAPNLCISVVGGAKNFKLDGRNRETFNTGLIKAAKTTDAWLISSGFNMGVMKAVGQAVSEGQSFTWDDDRMAHVLRCIAIAPWGYVRGRRFLESYNDRGRFPANYKTSNSIPHNQPVPLNENHTHFILVDDGFRNNFRSRVESQPSKDGTKDKFRSVPDFRAEFQARIAAPVKDGGLGIPVVLLIVEGGEDTLSDALKCLEHDIPVVVCAGTGRAANILAYAYDHTKPKKEGEIMKAKYQRKLGEKIIAMYGEKWAEDEIETKVDKILGVVLKCCEKREMMIIFHMNKHEDLDFAILSALLKGKKKSSSDLQEETLNKLSLAMTWNRADIAQEEIFREDVLWKKGSLDTQLLNALLLNKVDFVKLLLNQGIMMSEFLTTRRLQELYEKSVCNNKREAAMKNAYTDTDHLIKMSNRLGLKGFATSPFDLNDVNTMITILMDKYDDNANIFDDENDQDDQDGRFGVSLRQPDGSPPTKLDTYKYPYKQLLIWAVLLNRQEMAKFFWQMGTEPINSAIAVSRIYGQMSKFVHRNESTLKEKIEGYKGEFEQLAVKVLDECHIKDRKKAIMLVERKSPTWSKMTAMQMAASAGDQAFLASAACQNSIDSTLKRGILSAWKRIFFAALFPFLIVTKFIEVSKLGEKDTNILIKFFQFYTAPATKFALYMMMYLCFLGLYTYMLLVDFSVNKITYIEIVCIFWSCTFIVDEIYTFITYPSPTTKGKLRDWYGALKIAELLNLVLHVIAFIVHSLHYNQEAKTIYCINGTIFCIGILKTYTANNTLGPKLVMIKNMITELSLFVMILLVFLFAYGISSQGLLYLQRQSSWSILKDVLYYPYWQLYGEIFLEALDTDTDCVDRALQLANSSNTTVDATYCRTFNFLVPLFLAVYLIIGNILLLNLLIAIFSNVFKSVDDNSKEIWKYHKYFLAMEYDNKSALAPPLSIITHTYWFLNGLHVKHAVKRRRKVYSLLPVTWNIYSCLKKKTMSTYLRRFKEEQKSASEKFDRLQKRVDELFKLIEDEFIAEVDDNRFDENRFLETLQQQQQQRPLSWPDPESIVELSKFIAEKKSQIEPIEEEKKEAELTLEEGDKKEEDIDGA
ncbi:hypothetical protein KUTeg_005303 [Tegillarca granosa]|uniref:Transient receptor potential cation channel subfamily M member 3 n=1 Tax=Tegillarca granosa TaxID=220873 RepID=A0ABQ9FJE4_TEGGR|nr:hypothetical protein KUTeg_005303 [Tegillarca granosa]